MKLILSTSSQHLSLKSLLTKEITGVHLDVSYREEDESPFSSTQSAPLLELDSGMTIFSPNGIVEYLFEKAGQTSDQEAVDDWLEWESSYFEPYLQPYLVSILNGSKIDGTLTENFNSCVKHLDSSVCGKQYLIGTSVSAADVVIWAALYPLAAEPELCSAHLKDYPHLTWWFQNLAELPPFEAIVHKLTNGKGPLVFKNSILLMPPPFLPVMRTAKVEANALPISSTESPPHQLNHVSPEGQGQLNGVQGDEEQDLLLTLEEVEAAYWSWLNGHRNTPEPRENTYPILPQEGVKNILITSALPYVNSVPHLGNIIGCVLSADAFARYCRLRNYNTLYISGTDEYGTATETKALQEGVSPREICDTYHKLHSEIYEWFHISFDYFGRTTTQQQTLIAQDIFWRLHNKDFLLENSMDQQLCIKCDRFLADRFIEGICPLCGYEDARGDQCDKCGKLINAIDLKSPRCKLCQAEPVVRTSKHLFLDLPKLEERLSSWFEKSSSSGLWSLNAKMITRSWLKDGLKPRCITRDLKWGTPVPLDGYTDKVFYVWFDAPIGYLSITANYTDEWEKWWKNPSQVQLYMFMAKDNVPFHGVVFPSMQLGTEEKYSMVNHLVATEYLNYEDEKFSKSRGVGVFGDQAKDTGIPADIWRFYLLYMRPESQDSAFSWSDLMLKNNSELLNNLGNFINRNLMFLENNFGSVIPEMKLTQDDKLFVAHISRQLNVFLDLLEKVKIRDAIRHILNISRHGNQHIQNNKPWVLVKGGPADIARAGSLMGLCANVSCLLSVMVQPYMPGVSRTIQQQLNAPEKCNVLTPHFVCHLRAGHVIGKPSPLFQKLEANQIEELKRRFAGQPANKEVTPIPAERKLEACPTLGIAGLVGVQIGDAVVIERLQSDIAQQGGVVRELKASKADKCAIDSEVGKLLDLKRLLAMVCGQEPEIAAAPKKKKGKK